MNFGIFPNRILPTGSKIGNKIKGIGRRLLAIADGLELFGSPEDLSYHLIDRPPLNLLLLSRLNHLLHR